MTQSSEDQPISPAEGRAGNSATDTINTSPLPRGSEQSREEIARIIEPIHWSWWDAYVAATPGTKRTPSQHSLGIETSCAKADQILALLSTAHAEGLGKEDEYGVQTHVEPQHCTGWRDMSERPRGRSKVALLWADGSGAGLYYATDDGELIDAEDGCTYSWESRASFSAWAYLPWSHRLWIEDSADEPFTLPPPSSEEQSSQSEPQASAGNAGQGREQ